jgi:hypothetical protein
VKAAAFFALLLVPAGLSARGFEAPGLAAKRTTSDPPINLAHIDYGEINRHGEAVGYHHRLNGEDPPGARVERIVRAAARYERRLPGTGCGARSYEWYVDRQENTLHLLSGRVARHAPKLDRGNRACPAFDRAPRRFSLTAGKICV